MLETNENNFSEEDKAHVYKKKETKGYDIRKENEDNEIRIISIQIKSVKGHGAKLKENLDYALKEANNKKLDQK